MKNRKAFAIPKQPLAGEYHCFCELLKTQSKISPNRVVINSMPLPALTELRNRTLSNTRTKNQKSLLDA